MRKFVLAMAAMTIFAAQATEQTDTVKVINHAKQVVITERRGDIRMRVNGLEDDDDYNYEYRVKQNNDGTVTATQTENKNVTFGYPFKRCDPDRTDSHFEVFLSDVYVGWGHTKVGAANSDQIRNHTYEAGILNLLGVGYNFNLNRSRLSLGVGFNWAFYCMKNPYLWARNDEGQVVYDDLSILGDYSNRHSNLVVRSLQFPLMFNQRIAQHVNVAVAGVMNWNYYANLENRFRIGKTSHKLTTNGLHQRKVSFDVMAIATFKSLGVYFRYSPQSVFKGDWGPELKNRWNLGLILHGF
ncbi:MAG: hypothetical protein IJ724_13395 [Muribaculaceae bacterium]|nr:hypothetical protein [Muribaculaceae bacterium]MBR1727610.1 hypothetical protein [Muribaculaceae bacterium]